MACSLKLGCASISASNETILNQKLPQQFTLSTQINDHKSKDFNDLSCQFMGQSLYIPEQNKSSFMNLQSPAHFSVQAQASYCVNKALRWWEKTLKPNMIEIHSAIEFVDALKSAGDNLVIVDFYSPGCGGCKSLHPKICQLADSHPDAIFLKVNYEELKPMCHALHVHVLPFFRFYRGAEGKICSFSCTISTIKKFKDALAKHKTARCSLGPAKGLDESELLKLATIGELTLNSPRSSSIKEGKMEEFVLGSFEINPSSLVGSKFDAKEDNNAMLVA